MGGPGSTRHSVSATGVPSPGLLGQMTSFLLYLRGKVQTFRRRQLVIIFLVLALVAVVLQTEESIFSRDLNVEHPDPVTTTAGDRTEHESNPGSIAQKTAFDAVIGGPVMDGSPQTSNSDQVAPEAKHQELQQPETNLPNDERDEWESDPVSPENEGAEEQSTIDAVEVEHDDTGEADQADTDDSTKETDVDQSSPTNETNQTVPESAEATDDAEKGTSDESAAKPASTNDAVRNLHTGKTVKELSYERTKCFSASGTPHNHTCAPAVVVAGYEKCGTSALYYKLTKHPEIIAHPKWKELCPEGDSLEEMWSWFEVPEMPVLEDKTRNGLLLNGCIGIVSKPLILKQLQRFNPNLKVLVALRNYADWAYSYYGYRCYSGYDKGCEELAKPNRPGPWKDTRNPENFDTLVEEIKQAGKSPYSSFGVIGPNIALFRPWLEELVDLVGQDAVHIIKQEDLSFSPRETLEGVGKFLEVDINGFPEEAYTLVSNTNDHPSQISSVSETSSKSELSAVINSGSVVLNGTRLTLNEFWKSECEWLRDNFDVHFSEVC